MFLSAINQDKNTGRMCLSNRFSVTPRAIRSSLALTASLNRLPIFAAILKLTCNS